MGKFDKSVLVYMDAELRAWLDEKASRGYTRGPLIRYILRKQMEFEKGQKSEQAAAKGQKSLNGWAV